MLNQPCLLIIYFKPPMLEFNNEINCLEVGIAPKKFVQILFECDLQRKYNSKIKEAPTSMNDCEISDESQQQQNERNALCKIHTRIVPLKRTGKSNDLHDANWSLNLLALVDDHYFAKSITESH